MFWIIYMLIFGIFHLTLTLTIHHTAPDFKEQHKKAIPILKQEFQIQHDGYEYGYETGNGIHVQETGYLKNKGDKEHETIVQQGQVTYHDEHGNPITLTYIADENGFQPQGAHLPTPPPIPQEISKTASVGNSGYSQDVEHEDYSSLQFPHAHYAIV